MKVKILESRKKLINGKEEDKRIIRKRKYLKYLQESLKYMNIKINMNH